MSQKLLQFTIVYLDNQIKKIIGYTRESACRLAGIQGGYLRAVDTFSEGDPNIDGSFYEGDEVYHINQTMFKNQVFIVVTTQEVREELVQKNGHHQIITVKNSNGEILGTNGISGRLLRKKSADN